MNKVEISSSFAFKTIFKFVNFFPQIVQTSYPLKHNNIIVFVQLFFGLF